MYAQKVKTTKTTYSGKPDCEILIQLFVDNGNVVTFDLIFLIESICKYRQGYHEK